LGKFKGKIEILNAHNLLGVCRKIATACPPPFLTYDAAVSCKFLASESILKLQSVTCHVELRNVMCHLIQVGWT